MSGPTLGHSKDSQRHLIELVSPADWEAEAATRPKESDFKKESRSTSLQDLRLVVLISGNGCTEKNNMEKMYAMIKINTENKIKDFYIVYANN